MFGLHSKMTVEMFTDTFPNTLSEGLFLIVIFRWLTVVLQWRKKHFIVQQNTNKNTQEYTIAIKYLPDI